MTTERAEQAALGYFMGWIKAMTEGDQWVRFHSRVTDGDRGGIHSLRIEVDGVLLAVIPDPISAPNRAAKMAPEETT